MTITNLAVCALVLLMPAGSARAQENETGVLTISDGIRRVLKDNRLLKISIIGADEAAAGALIARSALLPRVSASLTDTFLNHQPAAKMGGQKAITGEKESLACGVDVYQTLFDFGRSLANYRASKELVNAGKANIAAVKKISVLEFIISYFNLLETEKMISVAMKEVESLEAYRGDIRRLYTYGAAVKSDVLPAQVKLADARQRLIAARNRRSLAAAQVNNILGVSPRAEFTARDIVMDDPQIPRREDAWTIAQAQRPEIAVLDDQIKASALSEKAKSVQNYPVVFSDAGYSYAENKYLVHDDNLYFTLGARSTLYDAGAAGADAAQERLRRSRLDQQKSKLIDDIRLEIENGFLGLSDAREKAAVAKNALEQAGEHVRVTRIKYTEGSATTTDVLAAIALQTGAETNYCSADYEVKRGYAKLLYSMGIDLALVYDKIETTRDEDEK